MNSLIFVGDATPMENLLTKMAENSMMATALILMVWMFHKQSKSRDEAFQKQQDRWQAIFDERQEKSELVHRDGQNCIRENTKALGEISALLREKKT